MSHDPYLTLGVDRCASPQQIRRAYYRLARRYHPDRNQFDPDAIERFKQIQSAYEQIEHRTTPARADSVIRATACGVGSTVDPATQTRPAARRPARGSLGRFSGEEGAFSRWAYAIGVVSVLAFLLAGAYLTAGMLVPQWYAGLEEPPTPRPQPPAAADAPGRQPSPASASPAASSSANVSRSSAIASARPPQVDSRTDQGDRPQSIQPPTAPDFVAARATVEATWSGLVRWGESLAAASGMSQQISGSAGQNDPLAASGQVAAYQQTPQETHLFEEDQYEPDDEDDEGEAGTVRSSRRRPSYSRPVSTVFSASTDLSTLTDIPSPNDISNATDFSASPFGGEGPNPFVSPTPAPLVSPTPTPRVAPTLERRRGYAKLPPIPDASRRNYPSISFEELPRVSPQTIPSVKAPRVTPQKLPPLPGTGLTSREPLQFTPTPVSPFKDRFPKR